MIRRFPLLEAAKFQKKPNLVIPSVKVCFVMFALSELHHQQFRCF